MSDPNTPCTCITAHDRMVCVGWCEPRRTTARVAIPVGEYDALRRRADEAETRADLAEARIVSFVHAKLGTGPRTPFSKTTAFARLVAYGRELIDREAGNEPRQSRTERFGQVFLDSAITLEQLEALVEGPCDDDAAARAGDRLFAAFLNEMRAEADHG